MYTVSCQSRISGKQSMVSVPHACLAVYASRVDSGGPRKTSGKEGQMEFKPACPRGYGWGLTTEHFVLQTKYNKIKTFKAALCLSALESFFFFFNIYSFFFFLTALGLSCDMCGTPTPVAACGIQFSDQRLNLGPLHGEHRVLAAGPPGNPYWPFILLTNTIGS